jgi:DNA-binding PadR family transcriptional regulator
MIADFTLWPFLIHESRNIENYLVRDFGLMSRDTFYRKFRDIKKKGYLSSKTNEEHKVVWGLSEEGNAALNEFKLKILFLIN